MIRFPGRIVPVLLFLSLAAGGCVQTNTTAGGAVGVEREQTMLVSAAEVNKSADAAYRKTLQQAQSAGRLNRDPAVVQRVRGIASRLTAAAGAFRPDAPGWRWEVNVITSNELNAWCMPGGKIAVYTGIIERLDLTDAELAAVMGHEIAHALREHGREKAGQAAGVGVAAAIGGGLDRFVLRHRREHRTECIGNSGRSCVHAPQFAGDGAGSGSDRRRTGGACRL